MSGRKDAGGFAPAPLPAPAATATPIDPLARALAGALAEGISVASATAPRSLQTALGFSQLGGECDRRLLHHLRGTPPVNVSDPLRSVVGTGVHLILADYFRRLDAGSGRYLVETPLLWRGVPGTADLFDRLWHCVVDWKTTTVSKVKRYASQGPTKAQVVQVMGYGAALQAAGEDVRDVALAYVPTDGVLTDIHVWRAQLDVAIAEAAVDRLSQLATVESLADATRAPSPLCGWCPFHRPGSTDPNHSCPGKGPMS